MVAMKYEHFHSHKRISHALCVPVIFLSCIFGVCSNFSEGQQPSLIELSVEKEASNPALLNCL